MEYSLGRLRCHHRSDRDALEHSPPEEKVPVVHIPHEHLERSRLVGVPEGVTGRHGLVEIEPVGGKAQRIDPTGADEAKERGDADRFNQPGGSGRYEVASLECPGAERSRNRGKPDENTGTGPVGINRGGPGQLMEERGVEEPVVGVDDPADEFDEE